MRNVAFLKPLVACTALLRLQPGRSTLLLCLSLGIGGCGSLPNRGKEPWLDYVLDYKSRTDPFLQLQLETIDQRLRARYGMTPQHTAVGVLDLRAVRLAMLHPDRIEYAASVPKIAILLAWFEAQAAATLDATTRQELGLMVKASSNEMASRFSRRLGLSAIEQTLRRHQFYNEDRGGGLWMGKHYGQSGERRGDPLANHSHAATVRQLLRFYLLLEQGRLVSPDASRAMREIFDSPAIPHDPIKFVEGLSDRKVRLRRKWGSWENWRHDTAVITGGKRHYILVALTHHPSGDLYLSDLAGAIDDLLLQYKPERLGQLMKSASRDRPGFPGR